MIRKVFGLIALIGLGTTAQAAYIPATWTDTVTTLAGGNYIADGQTKTYTHDLSPEFTPGADYIENFNLTIKLFDDKKDSFWDFEGVLLTDALGLPIGGALAFSNFVYEGAFLTGWAELNVLGTLTVSISSLYGDFMFGSSELKANGFTEAATSVPEPATLALMGLGLLGVGFGARRRKAAGK